MKLLQGVVTPHSKLHQQTKILLQLSKGAKKMSFLHSGRYCERERLKTLKRNTIKITLLERSMIRELSNKAKERSKKEPSDSKYIWRVRGNPSNGLDIKRMKIKVAVLTD